MFWLVVLPDQRREICWVVREYFEALLRRLLRRGIGGGVPASSVIAVRRCELGNSMRFCAGRRSEDFGSCEEDVLFHIAGMAPNTLC